MVARRLLRWLLHHVIDAEKLDVCVGISTLTLTCFEVHTAVLSLFATC